MFGNLGEFSGITIEAHPEVFDTRSTKPRLKEQLLNDSVGTCQAYSGLFFGGCPIQTPQMAAFMEHIKPRKESITIICGQLYGIRWRVLLSLVDIDDSLDVYRHVHHPDYWLRPHVFRLIAPCEQWPGIEQWLVCGRLTAGVFGRAAKTKVFQLMVVLFFHVAVPFLR